MRVMPLICPGCGGRMDVEAEKELVSFSCPYCAVMLSPSKNGQAVVLKVAPAPQVRPAAPAGEDVSALLRRARDESDPVKRYALLQQAETEAPHNLKVQKALLLHGRLHERNGRRIDFSVIKCYLLNVFEEPGAHTSARREEMIRELFSEERLVRAMGLAPDPTAFLREYLTELSREYVHLFLRGSSRYMKPLFGFAPSGKPARLLAAPAAAMLSRMLAEPALSEEQKEMLSRAFYQACVQEFDGETSYLNEALGDLRERFNN